MKKIFWKYRYFIFLIWLGLTITGAVYTVKEFRIDNSVGIWFAQDDPDLAEYREFLDKWGQKEWTLVMIKCDNVRDEKIFPKLRKLSEKITTHENAHKVLSIANLPQGHPYSEKFFLRPDNKTHTLLYIQTDNFFDRQTPYRGEMLDGFEEILKSEPYINEFHIAGTSVINSSLNRAALYDMILFFSLVTVFLIVSCLYLMRSIRDTVVLLAIAFSTVLLTVGLISFCGYSLNIVTIMLPAILIALSTADAVHLIHTYHSHRKGNNSKDSAMLSVKELWLPCLGTTITTVAGFMSLSVSPVIPVFQLAVFCSFGITCAWLTTVLVAPVILDELWKNKTHKDMSHKGEGIIVSLLKKSLAKPIMVMITFIILCFPLTGLNKVKADTNYVNFFHPNTKIPKTYAALKEVGFAQSPLVIVLKNKWKTPSQANFEKALEKLPHVKTVAAPAFGLTQALELVSPDGTELRIVLMTDYLGSQDLLKLIDQVKELKKKYIPDMEMKITGTTVLWGNMDSSVIATQKNSLLIMGPVMLVILCLLFRSLVLGFTGWILSCLPVAIILGIMGLMGIEINIATVLIAGVTLGLAVDDTIHFIFAFKDAKRKGLDNDNSAIKALDGSGIRIILTTLIVMGGFACMGVSAFQPTSHFGILTCLTIGAAALIDLTVLPITLKFLQSEKVATIEEENEVLEQKTTS